MNKSPWLARPELNTYIKMAVLVDAMEEAIKFTTVPRWRNKMKIIRTFMSNILKERMDALDPVELSKLYDRLKSLQVYIYTNREVAQLERRLAGKDDSITIEAKHWFLLLSVIDQCVCRKCLQGDKVKKCEIRDILHKSMCPVYDDNPADGECEFHWDSNCREVDIDMVDY